VFNWNNVKSFENFIIPTFLKGKLKVVMNSDRREFGGHDRVSEKEYMIENGKFITYLPSRVVIIFEHNI